MKKINLLAVILFFVMTAEAQTRVYSGKYDENPDKPYLFISIDF